MERDFTGLMLRGKADAPSFQEPNAFLAPNPVLRAQHRFLRVARDPSEAERPRAGLGDRTASQRNFPMRTMPSFIIHSKRLGREAVSATSRGLCHVRLRVLGVRSAVENGGKKRRQPFAKFR